MTTYLYIVRHGEAEPMCEQDDKRKLTEHGQWEAKRTALWLKTQVNQFDRVYVSPYVRAQQSKDIICEMNTQVEPTHVLQELTPSGDAARCMDYILASLGPKAVANSQPEQNILCVSHMPLVSYLIGEFTGYTPIMATAGVAKIKLDIDKWSGLLESLLAPEQML
mgnify:FL=1